jgi:4-hydroxy-L-threonine phosphate dehydrogenase PdxA
MNPLAPAACSRPAKRSLPQGTSTWSGHVEWFRRRRAKAAIWLMRKGLRAKQIIRVRQSTHLVLLQVGMQGLQSTALHRYPS